MRQRGAIDLPGRIPPELAAWCAWIAAPLREGICRGGVIAGWLDARALFDARPLKFAPVGDGLLTVLLVEPGFEGSDAVAPPGGGLAGAEGGLVQVRMAEEALRDALELDEHVAVVVATGYRLCGTGREALELESLAREVIGAV